MNKQKYVYVFIIFLVGFVNFHLLGADYEGEKLLNEGIEYFSTGLYKQAIINFRDILINPDLASFHGSAYFWISKSYMVLGKLNEAEKNLEFYLLNFLDHSDYSEAMYQKGRLLFMQNEYENAIHVLNDFIDKYPNSLFHSNAYFWIGESLFLLGKLDDALLVFKNIVQNFNTSFKYEAAKYRMSIIEFKKRENELLKLLKWSHMESLKSLEEFQKKERTYEQAISSYQKKLAILDTSYDNSIQSQVVEKDTQIRILQAEVAELKKKIISYEAALADRNVGASATDIRVKEAKIAEMETRSALSLRLLGVKEDALKLKEILLDFLENNTEGGGNE